MANPRARDRPQQPLTGTAPRVRAGSTRRPVAAFSRCRRRDAGPGEHGQDQSRGGLQYLISGTALPRRLTAVELSRMQRWHAREEEEEEEGDASGGVRFAGRGGALHGGVCVSVCVCVEKQVGGFIARRTVAASIACPSEPTSLQLAS